MPWPFQRIYDMPGHKLLGLLITHDPNYKIGEDLVKILYGSGAYLISLLSTSRKEGEEDLAIIDLTNLTVDAESLKKDIRRIRGVIKIDEIEPVDEGLLVDYIHYPLTLLGGRALLLREPAISKIITKGYERFGEPFSIWLYYVGKDAGRAYYKSHVALLRDFNEDKVLKLSRYMFQLAGFGLLEHVSVNKDEVIVRVRDSMEVEVNSGSGRTCQFIRGMLGGWFSELFGKEVTEIETKCANRGDEYCEFDIRPKA